MRGDRPRRVFRKIRELNACSTGWPGGSIHVPPGAPVPPGFVRTGAAYGLRGNPRCYPGTFFPEVATPAGGSLVGAVNLARNEAQRLALETRIAEVKASARAAGTSIEAKAAFALRYSDDLCTPYFCHRAPHRPGDLPGWSVVKGRDKLAELVAKGREIVPLDNAALRVKLGREPTPAEQVGACEQGDFRIEPERLRGIKGAWTRARTALEQATGQRPAAPRVTLKAGSAPGPTAPGALPLEPVGLFPAGTHVYGGAPRFPYGAPQFYDGPYIPGMEAYWIRWRGGIFLTLAEAQAAMAR